MQSKLKRNVVLAYKNVTLNYSDKMNISPNIDPIFYLFDLHRNIDDFPHRRESGRQNLLRDMIAGHVDRVTVTGPIRVRGSCAGQPDGAGKVADRCQSSLLAVSGRDETVVKVFVLLGRRRFDRLRVHVLAASVEATGRTLKNNFK